LSLEIEAIASSSSGNCYLLNDDKSKLMIECGIPFKRIQRALYFRLSECSGCLISHEHQDHAKAAKELMRTGIDCYMSAGTAEEIGAAGHRLKIVKHGEKFTVGPWIVLPFSSVHDCSGREGRT